MSGPWWSARFMKGESCVSRASEQKNSYFHSFLLLMTATIWGVAFVAQSVGMDHVGPITFVAARNVVAVVALIPVLFYFNHRNARKNVARPACDRRTFWTGGILCGTLLFGGMVTQQIGLVYTTVGKAGFITTTYVVLVPLLGIILGRKIGLRMWLAVLLALAGLYFLCVKQGEFSIGLGDSIVLLCAFFYTIQITCVDYYVQKIDSIQLNFMQMAVCAVLGSVSAVIFEDPSWANLLAAALPILYAGVCSSAMGFTFQTVAQEHVSPTVASLIMSLESCISAIAGWALLGQVLSSRELAGCVFMFCGIVLSQLPEKIGKR